MQAMEDYCCSSLLKSCYISCSIRSFIQCQRYWFKVPNYNTKIICLKKRSFCLDNIEEQSKVNDNVEIGQNDQKDGNVQQNDGSVNDDDNKDGIDDDDKGEDDKYGDVKNENHKNENDKDKDENENDNDNDTDEDGDSKNEDNWFDAQEEIHEN